MTVTVRVSIPRSEVREYREEYMECNPWEISDEEIKQDFLDRFGQINTNIYVEQILNVK